jgi:hypothetical protein
VTSVCSNKLEAVAPSMTHVPAARNKVNVLVVRVLISEVLGQIMATHFSFQSRVLQRGTS